jgi:hypothetical protein
VFLAVLIAAVSVSVWIVSTAAGQPPARHAEEASAMRDRVERHVIMLAGEIGERNLWHPRELDAAAEYIAHVLETAGYTVGRQEFEARGMGVANIEAELAGGTKPAEIVVVGAHYDSVVGCPGANDNATGVAAMLEIARALAGERMSRTVRFVAFVNEEPPFFQTDAMGSRRYAQRARERGETIVAMLSLETIGHYSTEKRSQRYPFPFGLIYPDTANFVGIVGNLASRRLVGRVRGAFGRHSDFPAHALSAPSWMSGIGWSDQCVFWDNGYRAVMITDTALFRYPYYHTAADTPDKIDYESLSRVTRGLVGVVRELANE